MDVNLILAMCRGGAIGFNNQLILHSKEDMKHFKTMTTGGVVVMGRKTYESLPNKKPLPGRVNVVVSKTLSPDEMHSQGFHVIPNLDAVAELPDVYMGRPIWIIGGAEIYKQVLTNPKFELNIVDLTMFEYTPKSEKVDAWFDIMLLVNNIKPPNVTVDLYDMTTHRRTGIATVVSDGTEITVDTFILQLTRN